MNILVTDYNRHWDKIKSSYYTKNLINDISKLGEYKETIFIKINKSSQIERGWKGEVSNIEQKDGKVYFNVKLDQELDKTELKEYENYKKSGWYIKLPEHVPNKDHDNLLPKFIDELKTTTNPFKFEDLVYIMLRLLGIHEVSKFPRDDQAGKPDGFFRLRSLTVIYDCTLRPDFVDYKKQQIENFSNQLLGGTILVSSKKVKLYSTDQKQVWIITKGKSRIVDKIVDRDTIIVKEISFEDIKDIYLNRLLNEWTEGALENELRSLGG